MLPERQLEYKGRPEEDMEQLLKYEARNLEDADEAGLGSSFALRPGCSHHHGR